MARVLTPSPSGKPFPVQRRHRFITQAIRLAAVAVVLWPHFKAFSDSERERPNVVLILADDKGYRADWIDEMLLDLGVTPVIPSKENEDRSARRVEFDPD
ncbi:MAG: hypothetical protein ACK5Q5_15810, partial [Planctomycetaceae bacterium]